MISETEARKLGCWQLTNWLPAGNRVLSRWGHVSVLEWCIREALRLYSRLHTEVCYHDKDETTVCIFHKERPKVDREWTSLAHHLRRSDDEVA